jgi:hypothetical protein
MFTYPATSLYNSVGSYTVVWSQEEFDAHLAEGWTEEPQPAEIAPAQPNKNKKK